MKNNIIYQFKSLLLKRAFFATLLLTTIFNNTIAQPGAIDPNFNIGTGANDVVYSSAIQSDGKIIIGGTLNSYNGTPSSRLVRLNNDGSIDASFHSGASCDVRTIAIQNDGKIIIGGMFTYYGGSSRNYIARINIDGTLDASFDPGTGVSYHVSHISIQSDGKIIICGNFASYNGTPRNRIARINTDGTIDASFNPGSGADWTINKTAIQNDGKIIIVGRFTTYNGIQKNRIARLNTDGSIDATFNPGAGADSYIETIAIQSNGKIIIGGWFDTYGGVSRKQIARLNADGSLDATFNPGTGANHPVMGITLQSDGKIIINGMFTSYNGSPRNHFARLNDNGSLDVTFNPGTGANNYVETTAIQSDGKIIIGGHFISYNGIARNRIARILGGNAGINSLQTKPIAIYPNPVSDELNIETNENKGELNIEIFNLYGQVVFKGEFIEKTIVQTDDFALGVYMVKVGSDKGYEIKKIVKH